MRGSYMGPITVSTDIVLASRPAGRVIAAAIK
jgi:hypothetical protein